MHISQNTKKLGPRFRVKPGMTRWGDSFKSVTQKFYTPITHKNGIICC